MNLLSASLLVVNTLWVESEIGLAVLRRSSADTARKDSGSFLLLNATIYGSVAIGMYLGLSGLGHITLPVLVLWLALLAIVLGLALRWWAVATLRRFFTVDVAIHPDHQLVQSGLYRFIRHPAYAGSLLSFAGLAVCSSSWLSLLIILVPITAAFVHRIRIEEHALLAAFPTQYLAYSAQTSRLIPGLY